MPRPSDVARKAGAIVRALPSERNLYRVRRRAPRVLLWLVITAVIAFVIDSSQSITPAFGWLSAAAGIAALVIAATWVAARGILWWRLGRAPWGYFAPQARRECMAGIYAATAAQTGDKGIALVRVNASTRSLGAARSASSNTPPALARTRSSGERGLGADMCTWCAAPAATARTTTFTPSCTSVPR
jgi:hypothetical protein